MIKLWNQTMPHRCVEDAFEPYLTPYDCDAAKTAIVVCPGGAYSERVTYEGDDVAAWLNTIGVAAFVLEYRVAPSRAGAAGRCAAGDASGKKTLLGARDRAPRHHGLFRWGPSGGDRLGAL